MIKLEDLKPDLEVNGILPNQPVTIIDLKWHGSTSVEIVYKQPDGSLGSQLLYREDQSKLEIERTQKRWTFSADGELFRLVAEAYRIHLAHLFDPVLAVHTSLIEPLPHQITGVYGDMLTRQPLRFLLADDPGAGKTIMTGLLIKELFVRGDVERCLICVPGNLAVQWQDELWFKFQLHFEILTHEALEYSASGNPLLEKSFLIMRLDQAARSEGIQERLRRSEWDLVVVDEAHKMSAHFWSGDLHETKRYKLGKLLRSITRHFLLLTATPHSGKEEDFQLFMALLDQDRFAGRFRQGVHEVDISDLMRRMVKEDLRHFDGRPLFPERRAYTVNYPLSPGELDLYEAVTEYVREEFNRAERLTDDKRRGTVGFALTILQRRLASSPEAIYQSIKRRRERLLARLEEFYEGQQTETTSTSESGYFDDDQLQDLDESPADELEELEEQVLDNATAALTRAELRAEIAILEDLEGLAFRVRQSGSDRKWEELAAIIQDDDRMYDPDGNRRKLVIFSEHRDTLAYLIERITTLYGRAGMLVSIDGSLLREKRRAVENSFLNDPDVFFLVATDAAGEGINLQRANLMINYDLPWNPNRLEQRFGRIHRIGQTEVCHLWNLVAGQTREGYVYQRLLRKLEAEGQALQGKVFDVLGELFQGASLRQLLVDAVRYGDQPEVRQRLDRAIDNSLDQERVRELLEARSLAADTLDTSQIESIRAEMERYAARRLQPHYIRSFFLKAFETLGGTILEREPGRYRINYVPARIRQRARELGTVVPVLEKYERICFDKDLIDPTGLVQADFVCPGHPLLDTVIDLMLDLHSGMFQSGAVLLDPTDPGASPRVMFFLQQEIQDAIPTSARESHIISREVHFVEILKDGEIIIGGSAPYLDYSPIANVEKERIESLLDEDWLSGMNLEDKALEFAVQELVPAHLERIRSRREERIDKTMQAVHERLTKEINYWDKRAAELRAQEKSGRVHARLNVNRAQARADEMVSRLEKRTRELDNELQVSALPPRIIGGVLVIPIGMLLDEDRTTDFVDRRVTESIAMSSVMEHEISLGNHPLDVSQNNLGYDIESFDPRTSRLRFLEVKGRRVGAETVTVTRNEILTGINSPDQFYLVIVEVEDGKGLNPVYISKPFGMEPDFGVTSVIYDFKKLVEECT
jgi:SNF2 family DNA or RNA helicase